MREIRPCVRYVQYGNGRAHLFLLAVSSARPAFRVIAFFTARGSGSYQLFS